MDETYRLICTWSILIKLQSMPSPRYLGSNKSDKSIRKVGRATIGTLSPVLDYDNCIYSLKLECIQRRPHAQVEKDVKIVVDELIKAEEFCNKHDT